MQLSLFFGCFVESLGRVSRDMFVPGMALNRRVWRGGPALRLPKFDPVTAKAGCQSEHRQRRWPEGSRAGRPESTRGFVHLSLRQIRQKPLSGLLSYLAEREGFEPSIELLTLYTLSRGAPSTTRPSLRNLALCHSLVDYRESTGREGYPSRLTG